MKRKQVRSACSNCRLKHARCDNERPCGGCVKAGLAESCVDAPRKQRKHNEEHSASRGAYNYLTLFDVRDSTKPSEKSPLYSLSSFTAPTDALVRISNWVDEPIPKIITLDTNKIYDAGPTDIQLPIGAPNFTYYSYEPSLGMPNWRQCPLPPYMMKSEIPTPMPDTYTMHLAPQQPVAMPGISGLPNHSVPSHAPYMYPTPMPQGNANYEPCRSAFSQPQAPSSPTHQITQNNRPVSLSHVNLRQPIKSPATNTSMTTSAPNLFTGSNQPNPNPSTLNLTGDGLDTPIDSTNESDTKSSPSFDELISDCDIRNFSIDFGSNSLSLKSSFRSDRSSLWSYYDTTITNELRRSQDLLSSFNFVSPLRRSFNFGGLKESSDAFPIRSSVDFSKFNLSDSFTFESEFGIFEDSFNVRGSFNIRGSFNDYMGTLK